MVKTIVSFSILTTPQGLVEVEKTIDTVKDPVEGRLFEILSSIFLTIKVVDYVFAEVLEDSLRSVVLENLDWTTELSLSLTEYIGSFQQLGLFVSYPTWDDLKQALVEQGWSLSIEAPPLQVLGVADIVGEGDFEDDDWDEPTKPSIVPLKSSVSTRLPSLSTVPMQRVVNGSKTSEFPVFVFDEADDTIPDSSILGVEDEWDDDATLPSVSSVALASRSSF